MREIENEWDESHLPPYQVTKQTGTPDNMDISAVSISITGARRGGRRKVTCSDVLTMCSLLFMTMEMGD